MTLISQSYVEQNRALHSVGNYGISSSRWAPSIFALCKQLDTRDVLDYGCGQKHLEMTLGFDIHNYDPCLPGLDASPEPADLVACTDVLEHIEPECLDAVLDDLKRVTKRLGFLVIDTKPAGKVLPDGRNAHLIQEPPEWWLPKLWERFKVMQLSVLGREFLVIVKPR